MRLVVFLPIAIGFLLAASCVIIGGDQLGDKEIQAWGTKQFTADKDKVIAAAVGALSSMGYEVAFAKPEKGIIQTAPKYIRTDVQGRGSGATGIKYTRQYMLSITESDGVVTVVANPRLFENDVDISHAGMWELVGEQQLWNELFRQIDLQL